MRERQNDTNNMKDMNMFESNAQRFETVCVFFFYPYYFSFLSPKNLFN